MFVLNIRPSAKIRQNYNEIANLCRESREPIYLTKNGEGDLAVMDIDTFTRREKMLSLREELIAVEEDRIAGQTGIGIKGLSSLSKMPTRFPFINEQYLPPNKYHKCILKIGISYCFR